MLVGERGKNTSVQQGDMSLQASCSPSTGTISHEYKCNRSGCGRSPVLPRYGFQQFLSVQTPLVRDTGKIRYELIQWLSVGQGSFGSCLSVQHAVSVRLLHLCKGSHTELPRCTKVMYWIFPLCLQPSLFCFLLSQLISTILAVKGPWEKGNQGVGWLFPI